jgi:hypothetical protein
LIPNKLVEAAFRRWWLLLVPIIAVPLMVFVLTSKAPAYFSGATIWISRPPGIDAGAFSNASNPYLTVAQNQTQVFSDLMQTESFRNAVAARVPGLDPKAGNVVAKSVSIGALGTNLVGISAKAPTPAIAQGLVSGTIAEYELRAATANQTQSKVQASYYQDQLGPAQKELAVRQAALTTYLQTSTKTADQRLLDPIYQQLTDSVESQNKLVSGLLDSLQGAQLGAVGGSQTLEALFHVLDQPKLPDSPVGTAMTKRLEYPLAGLLFGLLISATYVYASYRADHTLRSSQDLAGLDLPVLGLVPQLRAPRRGPMGVIPGWAYSPGSRDFARRVAASISTAE